MNTKPISKLAPTIDSALSKIAEIVRIHALYEGPPCNNERHSDATVIATVEHGHDRATLTLGDCRAIAATQQTMNTKDQLPAENPSSLKPDCPSITAIKIVTEVLKELRGRKGFGHWWDNIDGETQAELLFTLVEKVAAAIAPNTQTEPQLKAQHRVQLWDAINKYAEACGGTPGERIYGNTKRQQAVVEIEALVYPPQPDKPCSPHS